MCLVEIKNSSKAVISCVVESSVIGKSTQIYTQSPLTKKGRESILEFLLLNHPLDCPICDQAGECDLQEHSLKHGDQKKRFFSYKKDVIDKNIGPVIKTVMSRCIHCTRCVRFSNEISGTNNLGMFGRGSTSEIGTYYDKNFFFSELSGNVIDICPVGALTSKKYPFTERPWELVEKKVLNWTDSSGIELNVFFRNLSIVKVLSNYNFSNPTNYWITDKSRFGFDGFNALNKLNDNLIQKMSSPFEKLFFFDNSNFLSKIVNDVTKILYFNMHLCNHKKDTRSFFFLFDSNISINSLSFLTILTKKFKFLKIKNLKTTNPENDIESSFTVNNSFLFVNICLLINVNLRYDSFFLNIKLKKKLTQDHLDIYLFNSFVNLTYKTCYYGLNFYSVKNFSEGNSFLCQNFINCIFKTILIGSETSKRYDFEEFYKKLLNVFYFKNSLKLNTHLINFLNTTLNDTGITYLNFFKNVKRKDIDSALGFCFFNLNDLNNYELVKTANLKLMYISFLKKNVKQPKEKILLLYQNVLSEKKNLKIIKQSFFYSNTLKLLNNNVYFNESEMFMSFNGEVKKNCKVDYLNTYINEYWYFVSELVSNLYKFKQGITSLNLINYENFDFEPILYLHFMASSDFKKLIIKYQNKKLLFKNKLKNLMKKLKTFMTNHVLSTEDTYTKNEDPFSHFSINMFNMSFYKKILNTNIILTNQ